MHLYLASFHMLINEKERLEMFLPTQCAHFASGMGFSIMLIKPRLLRKDLLTEKTLTNSLPRHEQGITPFCQFSTFHYY